MAYNFHFDPVDLPPEAKELRQEVRAFLRREIEAGTFTPDSERAPFSVAKAFARKVGAQGWIGMTWPKQYGGHERSHLERYVVIEEMLAHRAPTRAYSTADRQSGPVILRYGQQQVKDTILPRIASGELCFCIGLSEPNSGSDVFAASTQATDELAYERSGPDRWLETITALNELVRVAGPQPGEKLAEGIGREVAHLATLRRMSASVAGMLQAGKTPAVEAAVVKDLGTNWEQALPNKVRLMAPPVGDSDPDTNDDRFEQALRHTTLIAPKLTIQGGTREVLRGIIARGLGLR